MSTSAHVRIEVNGEAEFSRTLHGLLQRIKSPRPFFERFAPAYIDLLTRRMDAEGAVDGEAKWTALSPAYARAKNRLFARGAIPRNRILQRTGALYEAVTQPEVEIDDQRLAITINADYAIYHQEGTSRMPRRVIASFTKRFRAHVMRLWRESMLAE